MIYVEATFSELQWEHEPEESDGGKGKEALERKVDCADIIGRVPMDVLFSDLEEDERILAQRFYFEQKSKTEIAQILGKPEEDVDREVENLKAKIRYRAKKIVAGSPVEDALVKMDILPAKQIAVKKPRAASKRAAKDKKAAAPAGTGKDLAAPK